MAAFDDVCILSIRAIVHLPINAPPGLWGECHKPIRQREKSTRLWWKPEKNQRRTRRRFIKAEFQWQTKKIDWYKRCLYFAANIWRCDSNHKISKKEDGRGGDEARASPCLRLTRQPMTDKKQHSLMMETTGGGAGSLADEQQGLELLWGYVRPISIFLRVNIQSSFSTASFVTLLSSKPTGKSAKCASISSIKAWGWEWIQQINNNL